MMKNASSHVESFFEYASEAIARIDLAGIQLLAVKLAELRERNGRLFLIGVGGSAANCSHAANDFRKLCGIEAYAPTDNVAELTARTNDEGWETVFSEWLKVSRANANDAMLVMSVGGGNAEGKVSVNIVRAIDEAKSRSVTVLGIVGRDGGYTGKMADVAIVIPTVCPSLVTPITEAFHALVWHCLVSDPTLQTNKTKW